MPPSLFRYTRRGSVVVKVLDLLNAVAIIPARYKSTRLEGKPLHLIGGHPMIEWVYRRSVKALGRAVVATDDERILETVSNFGGEVVMTHNTHLSGTSRCIEALQRLERQSSERFKIVVNVQGDEPFVNISYLQQLVKTLATSNVDIATLVRPFAQEEELTNPNWPKVVVNEKGEALYFSRSVIPYKRNDVQYPYLKHIGVYAFKRSILLDKLQHFTPSELEQCEGLEQLTWLYKGLSIQTMQVADEAISVDTLSDLEYARTYAQVRGLTLES